MSNYFFVVFFVFYFCLNTKRTQSNSENVYLINTKAIKKKMWFSFFFLIFDCFLFVCLIVNSVDCLIVNSVDCLITLINCVANLAILTHFEDGKEMNKESLLILFRFRYRFQRSFFSPPAPIYWLWRSIVYFFIIVVH